MKETRLDNDRSSYSKRMVLNRSGVSAVHHNLGHTHPSNHEMAETEVNVTCWLHVLLVLPRNLQVCFTEAFIFVVLSTREGGGGRVQRSRESAECNVAVVRRD